MAEENTLIKEDRKQKEGERGKRHKDRQGKREEQTEAERERDRDKEREQGERQRLDRLDIDRQIDACMHTYICVYTYIHRHTETTFVSRPFSPLLF